MARNPRKINPDMPMVGVSFDKGILEALRGIAKKEDRSLASLVRRIVNSWLMSPEGRAAMGEEGVTSPQATIGDMLRARGAAVPKFDVKGPKTAENVEQPAAKAAKGGANE